MYEEKSDKEILQGFIQRICWESLLEKAEIAQLC